MTVGGSSCGRGWRVGAADIPNSTIVMSDEKYLWPYPAIEREMGRVQ